MEIGASAADNGRASKEFIPTCTVSCAHAPASLLPPCPQARKGGGQMEKTHNTEGLGSENISMFFSNSIANKKGFLPRPARFRAWTGGAGREAGSWQVDTIEISPTLESAISSYDADSPVQLYRNGRVEDKELISGIPWSSVPGGDMMNRNRYISTQRQSAETRPVNIAVPVILYLGLRA